MKTKVSAFEYAIAEAAGDLEFMKTHAPRTREEELTRRVENLKRQAKKLKLSTDTEQP